MTEKLTSIRTYTEKLEHTIAQGVELRGQMRAKVEALEATVRSQKAMINQAVAAKEVYQKRLANYKRRLVKERERRQKAEGKLLRIQGGQ